jgi:hypothetical protein
MLQNIIFSHRSLLIHEVLVRQRQGQNKNKDKNKDKNKTKIKIKMKIRDEFCSSCFARDDQIELHRAV